MVREYGRKDGRLSGSLLVGGIRGYKEAQRG